MSNESTTARLEWVRKTHGFRDLRPFWRRVAAPHQGDDGYSISYDAVRTYHVVGREAPAAYLARVADVFGIRLVWLVTGRGLPTEAEMQGENDEFVVELAIRRKRMDPLTRAALGTEMISGNLVAQVWAFVSLKPDGGPLFDDARSLGFAEAVTAPIRALGVAPDRVSRYLMDNFISQQLASLALIIQEASDG